MKHRPRQPSWFYQRRSSHTPAKQQIHIQLRHDPTQTIEQLALHVGCSRAYARIWKHKFFASGEQSLAHWQTN